MTSQLCCSDEGTSDDVDDEDRRSSISGKSRPRRCRGLRRAVSLVESHAGCVGHGVGDVALLLDTVEKMGHGTEGVDSHVLPSVSL